MFALPLERTDPIALADWLEVHAATASDRNASAGDLERALARETEADDRERAEATCQATMTELEGRVASAGDRYPFEVAGNLLRCTRDPVSAVPYFLCLCLAFFDWEAKKLKKVKPEQLFERLCTVAAAAFISGDAVKFSTPRSDLPGGFAKAVASLCERLGECRWQEQPTLNKQDDHLDVVAWRHFPDRREGKLVMLGQCASGRNWRSKTQELQPEAFFQKWMAPVPVSRTIRAFFTPHRVPREQWRMHSADGGILFDRCRLAYCINPTLNFPDKPAMQRWLGIMLGR